MRGSLLFWALLLMLPRFMLAQTPAEPEQERAFTYKHTEHGDLELTVNYPPAWKASERRAVRALTYSPG